MPASSSPLSNRLVPAPGRRPSLRVVVVADAAAAPPLVFQLEVLGHDPIVVNSAHAALALGAAGADAYLIDSDLPDSTGHAVAELLRMDPSRADAWIFGLARYHRPHRAVCEDTGVFDEVLVLPLDQTRLKTALELARMPRRRRSS